jgi:hypothetical protein
MCTFDEVRETEVRETKNDTYFSRIESSIYRFDIHLRDGHLSTEPSGFFSEIARATVKEN